MKPILPVLLFSIFFSFGCNKRTTCVSCSYSYNYDNLVDTSFDIGTYCEPVQHGVTGSGYYDQFSGVIVKPKEAGSFLSRGYDSNKGDSLSYTLTCIEG